LADAIERKWLADAGHFLLRIHARDGERRDGGKEGSEGKRLGGKEGSEGSAYMPRVERRRAGLNPAKVKRKTGSHKKGGKGIQR